MDEKITKTVEALKKRGYEAVPCASAKEALDCVMKAAEGARTVGFGGSETIRTMGLPEALAAAGKELLIHGDPKWTPEQRTEIMKRQSTCDLFLLSANALTLDGRIVNIDGNGNRVGASIFGPKKVVFVVGRNKLVDGGIDAAIERIKRFSAPPNCRRLGRNTPCAKTGVCADCDSPDRICKVTVVFDRKPSRTDTLVVLVDEDLGY